MWFEVCPHKKNYYKWSKIQSFAMSMKQCQVLNQITGMIKSQHLPWHSTEVQFSLKFLLSVVRRSHVCTNKPKL
jgi:hypothetical protein